MKYHLASVKVAFMRKKKITNALKWEKKELLYTIDRNVIWYSHKEIKNRTTI